tara:strand:+ start:881 stop:1093 length:213 start_codon:yes stop_codon:yes gene_type:complete
MTYKMKGFSGFKSPLKQDEKKWDSSKITVDGKTGEEILKEQKEKHFKKIAKKGKQDKSPKSLKEVLKKRE